jgi:cytochrome c-type biogenesis protein CcmE
VALTGSGPPPAEVSAAQGNEGPTGDDHPTEASATPLARRRSRALGSRRRQFVAAIVIGGAIAYILVQGLSNATEYFKTADQAVADRAALGTRQFRIEGTVGPGVSEVAGATNFTITANNVTVQVVDTREPSQLFKTGIPVVLEGHWAGTVFQSDLVMVKHTASYAAAHPDRLKSQLPATTVSGGSGG